MRSSRRRLATLAVLGEQVLAFSERLASANDFIGAGVLGAVIFAIAAAAFPLARLEESEALAHQRGIDLANLAQLNEYIVQNLRESIVVVDGANNVRLMNQPAAEQLGSRQQSGQPLTRISPDLSRLLDSWRRGNDAHRQLPAFVSADGSMQINTHIAPLEGRMDGPVLIFEAGMLAEKVQQSKLAALGRLTASIAHEVRNPVGAMSNAGQLLEESPSIGPDERRLPASIIRTNSRRVSEIVDNILQLSRREAASRSRCRSGLDRELRHRVHLHDGALRGPGGGRSRRRRGSAHGPRPPAPDRLESLRERSEVRERGSWRHSRRAVMGPHARQPPISRSPIAAPAFRKHSRTGYSSRSPPGRVAAPGSACSSRANSASATGPP